MLNVPIRLILMTISKSCSGIGPVLEIVRPARPMPAQFTTTRGVPSFSTTAFTPASADAASPTSTLQKIPPSSLAFFSPSSALRSKIATLAPLAASALAVAPPRPDAPPVTMAASPLTSMIFPLSSVSSMV